MLTPPYLCCPILLRSAGDRFGGGGRGAVELMSSAPGGQPFTSKWSRGQGAAAAAAAGNGAAAGLNGSDRGANRDQRQQTAGVVGRQSGSDAGGGAAAAAVGSGGGALDPPVNLPAIKTSAGGAGSGAGAAANGSSVQQALGAAKFSLGDEEELHEIQLDSAKAVEKRD